MEEAFVKKGEKTRKREWRGRWKEGWREEGKERIWPYIKRLAEKCNFVCFKLK